MTDHRDTDLERLAALAPPPGLDDLEHRVASAIARAYSGGRDQSGRNIALAGMAALLVGLAGGGVMAGRIEARERPVRVQVALDAGLAPSTLLLGR